MLLFATLLFVGCSKPKPPPASPQERSRLSIVSDRQGARRIDGIGPIRGFAQGRDNTFMHCLELILDAVGRKIDYDELMGLSGMAFRTQFRTDRWDVGNSDPLVGERCVDAVMTAIGAAYEVKVVRREELAEAEALRQAISKSIDLGMPVLAANVIPPEDWGIILGYRDDRRWLCRAYREDARQTDRPSEGWPTAVVIINKLLARPSIPEAHAASIRRAVVLYEKHETNSYAVGSNAFDQWCDNLQTVSERSYLQANAWTYVGLIDARMSAVRYLRGIAKEFGSHEKRILEAADFYDQEVRMLREGYRYVPTDKAVPTGIPPANTRKKQVELLLRAKAFEQRAIDSLRKAL